MNNTELSCNNTVCNLNVDKSKIENTKKQIRSLARKTPVIFVENQEYNIVELKVTLSSITSSVKKVLEN